MPISELSRMTSPTKKSGRCHTYRDRPVCSMIATTSHATKKPSAPTIIIQGTNTSENLSSGRFSPPAKLVEDIWVQNFHQTVIIPVVHRNGDDDWTFERQRFLKRGRNFVGMVYLQPGSTERLG